MRSIKIIIAGLVLVLSNAVSAQVSVNVNIGAPPLWGPIGFPEVRYYYLPDVESYYDVQASMFVFNEGGVWVHRGALPGRFRRYDLYNGYKVVMTDYRGDAPYNNFKEYRVKYKKGYHGGAQKTIGERPGKGNGHKNEGNNHSEKSSGHRSEKRMEHSQDRSQPGGNNKSMKQGQGHEGGGKSHGGGKGKGK